MRCSGAVVHRFRARLPRYGPYFAQFRSSRARYFSSVLTRAVRTVLSLLRRPPHNPFMPDANMVFTMLMFLPIAGLAIDFSMLYCVKARLQQACDAGAIGAGNMVQR